MIEDAHRAFIAKQPVFFVATAAAGARINLSPKGMDCFRVFGPNRVGYLDLGGSGNETRAHLAGDGRITIMFCAFDNPAAHFPRLAGARQVFDIAVDSVRTSCGWGVPRMTRARERDTLVRYHAQQAPEARLAQSAGRTRSIDGLPVRVQTVMPPFDSAT